MRPVAIARLVSRAHLSSADSPCGESGAVPLPESAPDSSAAFLSARSFPMLIRARSARIWTAWSSRVATWSANEVESAESRFDRLRSDVRSATTRANIEAASDTNVSDNIASVGVVIAAPDHGVNLWIRLWTSAARLTARARTAIRKAGETGQIRFGNIRKSLPCSLGRPRSPPSLRISNVVVPCNLWICG